MGNTAAIKKYTQNQLKEVLEYDQKSLFECIDLLADELVRKIRSEPLGVAVENQSKLANSFRASPEEGSTETALLGAAEYVVQLADLSVRLPGASGNQPLIGVEQATG